PLIGGKLHEFASDMETLLKNMVVPGMLFEELGFKYLGPYDGHDLENLINVFEENKDYNGPLLVHVITKKGKGYTPAENKPIWSHGVTPFDIISGADGPTHQGIYDMAYLRIFPNMICMAPKDENELRHMVKTAFETGHPTSLRYPRGNGVGAKMDAELQSLPIGKGEVMREGTD